jgi:predicted transcriptional regulator
LGTRKNIKEDEHMKKEQVEETILKNISSYYRAIGSAKRLKILLALRENFIDGMKWPGLKELIDLSSGALKRHIDVLMEVGLIGKSNSNYRITQSGLGLLTQIDELIEKMKEILEDKEQIDKILLQH